ncbi:MAG TPA: hypothetical protein VIM73_00870, partial [Polyangiaceae bacterium]
MTLVVATLCHDGGRVKWPNRRAQLLHLGFTRGRDDDSVLVRSRGTRARAIPVASSALKEKTMVMRLSVDNHSALANNPYRTSDSARRKPTHRRWSGCLGALGVALAGAIWPVSAAAQETVSPPAPVDVAPRLFGLNGFGGVVLMDLGPINDRLADAGYPEDLPSLHAVVGGQGFGLFSRFLIGGSGFAILSRSADGLDDTEVSAGGAWGSFDFGYQAVRSDGFLLAPIASIGAYGMDVTIASTEGTTFDEALESPTRATT